MNDVKCSLVVVLLSLLLCVCVRVRMCSHSWRVVLRSACDLLTGEEVDCCSRIVQLCCDSLLAVYVASSECDPTKLAAAAAAAAAAETSQNTAECAKLSIANT